ncbi:MAG: DUF3574 domain-containing protein [Acidobacteria bacterium]|nr:DUF3574 domain-containing protein [Acidobacteriota bacterium]MBI3422668.1 DUF3574 domain-containing protein [Acidobacteriota bacterium]
MNKHLTNHLLMLALLVTTLFAPAGNAKTRPAMRIATAPPAAQRAEVWRRTELYFGSQKPDGTVVTEAQFMQFVDTVITPRFPDGLTVLTGYGQFRNSAGVIVKERSMELILLYPPQMRDADRKIEEIRTAYKQTFQQESVLRVDSLAAVSF